MVGGEACGVLAGATDVTITERIKLIRIQESNRLLILSLFICQLVLAYSVLNWITEQFKSWNK